MHFTHMLLGVDNSALGRHDIGAMSDQTCLEMLVADIKNIDKLKDSDGEFLPIDTWPGVTIENDVQSIDFARKFLMERMLWFEPVGPDGSIEFKWIPRSTRAFKISFLNLEGTMDTAVLPTELTEFIISKNKISGSFVVEHLPQKIESIFIDSNKLEGTLDIAVLPKSVRKLHAGDNDFSGPIDLTNLPEGMLIFNIARAKLSGSINLESLPAGLEFLSLEGNAIAQERLVFPKEKHPLLGLNLDKGNFGEIADGQGGSSVTTTDVGRLDLFGLNPETPKYN